MPYCTEQRTKSCNVMLKISCIMTVVMLMRNVLVYTPEDVARRLRVSEETVRREIRARHLSAQRIGKQYRIASSDLKSYLGEARFEEWFVQGNDLREAIGSGGLSEQEAIAFAEQAVRQVRESRPNPEPGRQEPTKSEVRAHLKAARQARATRV
jgi:excisionase family DNA binding protein